MDQTANSLRSITDEEAARIPKKRPRPVLSCFECRRKKLKCDRLLPCDQCKKSSRGARCTYAMKDNSPEPEDDDAQGTWKRVRLGDLGYQEEDRERNRGDDLARAENGINALTTTGIVGDLEDLKARVAKLERMLSEQPRPRGLEPRDAEEQKILQSEELQDPPPLPGDRQRSNLGMLVTKGNRSRYHAPDEKLPLLFRFEEALQFIQGLSKKPAIADVMKEVKLARKMQASKLKSTKNVSSDNFSSTSAAMRAALPPRRVCDMLTSVYFAVSENLLKILHRPTFLLECRAFWDREQELQHVPHSFVDDAVLSQLVAVVVIGSSLSNGDLGLTAKAVSRESLCEMLKSWVNALNSKRRLQLSTLQTQCLVLLAHQMLPSQSELLVNDSAALVRSSMAVGLHRDPRDFSNISLCEGELRRRLWMTIVELDMQISYTYGARPMVRDGDFSTTSTTKFDDDEIFEGMTNLPVSPLPNPLDEGPGVDIDRRFYSVLANYIQHRLKVIDFTNSIPHRMINPEEALKQGRKLEAVRDTIRNMLQQPAELRVPPMNLDQGNRFNLFVLYVYTVRPLLSMYRQHGFCGPENPAIRKIEETCVESSMDILSFLEILQPPKHSTEYGWNHLDLFHVLCKVDIMQAALTVCLAAKTMDEASPPRRKYKTIGGDKIWSRTDLLDRVYMTMNSLLCRKQDPIYDIRDPLCLTVIVQYLLHIDKPLLKDVRMQAGASITINSYLESLRQSTAKSTFNTDFDFELDYALPLTGDGRLLQPNEMAQLEEADLDQDMNFGSSEFDIDGFLDFGYSGEWDWQQGWP